jgi:hypothetical protein
MPSFNFNSAPLESLATGTYYATVVTATPIPANSTVADLTQPSGFTPYTLTGLSFTSNWTFDDFTFPEFTYNQAPRGIVIAKQVGGSPASSDPLINYSPFVNSLNQETPLSLGTYFIPVDFTSKGAITLQQVYRYESGSYVPGANGGFPHGLIYLLGTRNNTQSYLNPSGGIQFKTVISRAKGTAYYLTDRNTAVAGSSNELTAIYFDFGEARIRFGSIAVHFTSSFSPNTTTIYASNSLISGFELAQLQGTAQWTAIGSIPNSGGGGSPRVGAVTDQSTYWRYLKIESLTGPAEIEFYDSTIETPYLNFIDTEVSETFTHVADGDNNGLFYYLGTDRNTKNHNNPALNGSLVILASNPASVDRPVSNITDRGGNYYDSNSANGNYIAFALPPAEKIAITKYTIKHPTAINTAFLRSWVLEGTNALNPENVSIDTTVINAATWTVIDTHSNDATISNNGAGGYSTFTVTGASPYRFFRIRLTGSDSEGGLTIRMEEFEVYGTLTRI